MTKTGWYIAGGVAVVLGGLWYVRAKDISQSRSGSDGLTVSDFVAALPYGKYAVKLQTGISEALSGLNEGTDLWPDSSSAGEWIRLSEGERPPPYVQFKYDGTTYWYRNT